MFRSTEGKSRVGTKCEAVWGDGMVAPPEECDDNNSVNGKIIKKGFSIDIKILCMIITL